MPPVRVLVGVPTMGAMHPQLVAALLRWAREFKDDQVSFYFSFKVAPVDRARNEIVRYFLAEHEGREPFTHLLFLDADTIPPADALKRLLSHDKDIVSGLTPILHFNKKTGAWDSFDNCFTHQTRDTAGNVTGTHAAGRHTGLQRIFRCGSSCVLIKRAVFEKLATPFYEFIYNDDHTTHVKSEDINFCDKAAEAGIELWADTEVLCHHYKDVIL